MSKSLTAEEIINNAVGLGRAYVQIVETADALLERKPFWTEKLLLRIVRALYSHRLREVVATLPPNLTDEAMVASERMMGVGKGFTKN